MLLNKYRVSSLQDIHLGLNIKDRLAALIRKEKLLQYPNRTYIVGNILIYWLYMLSLYVVGV
jgi:hypothetical protein